MSDLIAEKIKALIVQNGVICDFDIVVHDSIGSTNNWAIRECQAKRALPFACFAEEQTKGKGRRGKNWLMLQKKNIAMSVAWEFPFSYQDLQLLPLSIAVSIAEVIESFNLEGVQVKWPNDVYISGKKIAGVLIETKILERGAVDKKVLAVVIGVGLNYDMQVNNSSIKDGDLQSLINAENIVLTDFCSVFRQQMDSARLSSQPDRLMLSSILLQAVMQVCEKIKDDSLFALNILNVFRDKYDFCEAKMVDIVLDNGSTVAGVAKGVTDSADLIVEVNGVLQTFNSADVSVRTGNKCR